MLPSRYEQVLGACKLWSALSAYDTFHLIHAVWHEETTRGKALIKLCLEERIHSAFDLVRILSEEESAKLINWICWRNIWDVEPNAPTFFHSSTTPFLH